MPAIATGSLYEVQGLAPCPAARHGRKGDLCSVPDGGEWHGIYFVDSRSEAEEILAHVMDSDSPLYDTYEDFRLAIPDPDVLKRRRESTGYAWERRRPRKVVEAASRTTISTGRKKGKRKKAA